MKEFKVGFSLADSEYMTALRLVVSAVCSAADMTIDAAEDLKVCVTESCLVLKSCGCEGVAVTLSRFNGVTAVVEGFGGEFKPLKDEFSIALVSALVSSLEIEKDGESVRKLTLHYDD